MRQKNWPARWTLHHGAIYFRVPDSAKHLWDGKSYFRLGKTEAEAWQTWFARIPVEDAETMANVFERYAKDIVPTKAPGTQRQYLSAITNLHQPFGHLLPDQITPRMVYQYLDARTAKVSANREKAVLSAVLSQCVRWGLIDRNPVKGQVERNPERPRQRFVTDAELHAFLAESTPFIRVYVALKMMTGLRQGEPLALRRTDWDGECLSVQRNKGGGRTIYEGEGIRASVRACLDMHRVGSMYLISTRRGQRYTGDGFRSIWQRCMKRYVAAGGEHFTEHDLRAKAASEATLEVAQALLGHRSPVTTEVVYRRKPTRIKT